MTASECNETILAPALKLLPDKMDSIAARRMLLAIGLQESRLIYRRQIKGPARGLWQFEEGGGVTGVGRHSASRDEAEHVCNSRMVKFAPRAVWMALETDDILAACFARLLLWTDPQPLPERADEGWQYYLRTWRPGKPHAHTWKRFWDEAKEAV
jgi:hypothetical protein